MRVALLSALHCSLLLGYDVRVKDDLLVLLMSRRLPLHVGSEHGLPFTLDFWQMAALIVDLYHLGRRPSSVKSCNLLVVPAEAI